MVGIDAYLFGYRVIKPEEGGEARLATALLKLGIACAGRRDGGFLIREADYSAFRAYAGGRVRYTATGLRGFPALLPLVRSRIPQLVSAVLSLFLVIFLSRLVWDVRVEGADTLSAEQIEDKLAEAGVGVGRRWGRIDPEEAETVLLDSMPELAWVQINRRGTVAEVIIKERAPTDKAEKSPYTASNIVAAEDGVIEEITVKRGRAEVKVGDVVRKGDVLISGIIENEQGTHVSRAEGSVIAHTAGRISASAAERETEIVRENGGVGQLDVQLFGLKINIFKKYGNSDTDCVIIENEVDYLYIFGKRLPIAIVRTRRYVNTERELIRQPSELPGIASSRLDAALADTLGCADLIKLKTSGEYTDGGYTLTAEYVVAESIGEERELVTG